MSAKCCEWAELKRSRCCRRLYHEFCICIRTLASTLHCIITTKVHYLSSCWVAQLSVVLVCWFKDVIKSIHDFRIRTLCVLIYHDEAEVNGDYYHKSTILSGSNSPSSCSIQALPTFQPEFKAENHKRLCLICAQPNVIIWVWCRSATLVHWVCACVFMQF